MTPIDQVARHRRADVVTAYQHPDFRGLACEINRGLARRIAAPDEDDFLFGAQLPLERLLFSTPRR
jgi:hypothetical protein